MVIFNGQIEIESIQSQKRAGQKSTTTVAAHERPMFVKRAKNAEFVQSKAELIRQLLQFSMPDRNAQNLMVPNYSSNKCHLRINQGFTNVCLWRMVYYG